MSEGHRSLTDPISDEEMAELEKAFGLHEPLEER